MRRVVQWLNRQPEKSKDYKFDILICVALYFCVKVINYRFDTIYTSTSTTLPNTIKEVQRSINLDTCTLPILGRDRFTSVI